MSNNIITWFPSYTNLFQEYKLQPQTKVLCILLYAVRLRILRFQDTNNYVAIKMFKSIWVQTIKIEWNRASCYLKIFVQNQMFINFNNYFKLLRYKNCWFVFCKFIKTIIETNIYLPYLSILIFLTLICIIVLLLFIWVFPTL